MSKKGEKWQNRPKIEIAHFSENVSFSAKFQSWRYEEFDEDVLQAMDNTLNDQFDLK